ncbi:Immunoglobulin E-set [Phytophthora cactorum]|nr:Immunoglobulin E-set [Phytophthora cactorum]
MGKMAKALGLGVKGSLTVALDRSHYLAGDLLIGSVVLSVTEPLDFTSLVVRICGKELLTWTEGGGQAAAVYLREHLHLDEEIILSAEQQSYQPGEYVYPICFQLADTLPNSFHISGCDAGVMSRIDASLSYSATAVMTAKKTFVVQQPPIGQPVRSLENSASGEIHMLRLMKKGTCSVSAQLPSNVHVAGDVLLAQTRVHNDTSKDMKKLSMMLFEDVTVDLGMSNQKSEGSTCVSRRDFPGVQAEKTFEQVLDLPLVTKTSPSRPVSAAIESHFLTTKYRLVIKCQFRLCRSVSVDFPVEILRKLVVGAAYAPTAAVLPAVAATAASPSVEVMQAVAVAPGENQLAMDGVPGTRQGGGTCAVSLTPLQLRIVFVLIGDELHLTGPRHKTPASVTRRAQLKEQPTQSSHMGKVAKCLGIGVKGSIRVMLHRESYAAGDLVQGQLVLRVSRSIECEEFSLHVEGAETIAWSEGANHSLPPCNMRDEFLCDRIHLIEPMPRAFEPGEYRFRFRYQLDDTLPPVFRVTEGFAGAMRDVNASVSYTIKARMGLQGKLVTDLKTSQDLAVHRPSLCHPVRSLQKSSSDEVRLLSLMKSKGACEVSVCLDSDVHISGSSLSLQTRISNSSSRDMQNLLRAANFPGVASGQLLDEVLYLPLIDDVNGRPIAPTNSAAFVRWQYRLEVKCRFMLSKSVKVEMPVIILRDIGAPPAHVDGATVPPAVVVVVPEADGNDGASDQQGTMPWSPSQVYAETDGDSVVARPIFIPPQAVAAV